MSFLEAILYLPFISSSSVFQRWEKSENSKTKIDGSRSIFVRFKGLGAHFKAVHAPVRLQASKVKTYQHVSSEIDFKLLKNAFRGVRGSKGSRGTTEKNLKSGCLHI